MSSHWNTIVNVLRDEHGIQFERGLADSEVEACEREFGIRFPPDLRDFLGCALPVSDRFPDWRNAARADLRAWLDLPVEGILFDVEHNGFWLPEWGPRPADFPAASRLVRALVAQAPKLIPVYAHRMIPDRPHAAGNPVFSVHQTDIIYYGCDLRDYFLREFFAKPDVDVWPIPTASLHPIEFWDVERFATRWQGDRQTFDKTR